MTMVGELRAHVAIAGHYARPAVRARIDQFFDRRSDGWASASDAAAYGGVRWLHGPEDSPVPRPASELPSILDEGADVLRSLADEAGALLLLDVDFVHPSDPGQSLREPERCFARLRHAHDAAIAAFAVRGIVPLVLLGASGFRYLARVPSGGQLYEAVSALGRRDGWLMRHEAKSDRAVAAHRGAARLAEFLAHEVLRAARASGPLPVSLADVPPAGADCFVRVDPCSYADAAGAVYLRAPFSTDQTPLLTRPGAALPFVTVLPCGPHDPLDLLPLRTDLDLCGRFAAEADGAIPSVPEDSTLLRDYERSAIAAFHLEMDRAPAGSDGAGHIAGFFDTESIPPCANAVLRHPSPRLFQPRHLRTVALTLWSMGWHPRTIAALVRSRFEDPHDWGTHWLRHDPAQTAAFLVRLFCGAAAVGLDDGAFSCETEARDALCPGGGCGYDLGLLFKRLRALRAREEAHA